MHRLLSSLVLLTVRVLPVMLRVMPLARVLQVMLWLLVLLVMLMVRVLHLIGLGVGPRVGGHWPVLGVGPRHSWQKALQVALLVGWPASLSGVRRLR